MKTKHFISISFLAVLLLSVTEVIAQEWEREYDEIAESGCGIWKICETEDGYIYANLGKQYQMNLFKAKKKDGEIIWHKEHRITSRTSTGKLLSMGEGKVLIVGSTYEDYLLIIIDSLGNELKRKVWRPDGFYDSGLSDVIQNEDGTYTALGFLIKGDGYEGSYFSLVKFSQNLEIIWEKAYLPAKGDISVQNIARDVNGCIIALGNIRGSYNNQQSGTAKFDGNGEIIWQKTYPESEHSFIAPNGRIVKCSDGYLACSSSFQDGPDGAALMKLDDQGNIVWFNENILQDTNYAWMINCWEIGNEYVGVVIAQPYSYPYVYPEVYFVKTDTLGKVTYKHKWQKTHAFDAILTQDSAILIAGGLSESGYNPWAFKTYLPEDSVAKPLPLPEDIKLAQNFPNPFNSTTTIEYQISEKMIVKIAIYDITGRVIKMFQKNQEPGIYTLSWDGKNNNGYSLPSGVYIYRMITTNNCRKMVLEK